MVNPMISRVSREMLRTEEAPFPWNGVSAGIVLRQPPWGGGGGWSWGAAGAFAPREVALMRRTLALHLNVAPEDLRSMRQVHGAEVVRRHREDALHHGDPPADAQWTTDTRLALIATVADCCPVVLADRSTGAVAIAHAGWSGAAAGVVNATARALRANGSAPGDLWCWVGPRADGHRYEVGEEVAVQFQRYPGALHPAAPHEPASRGQADRWFLDISAVVRHQAEEEGIPSPQVLCSPGGTMGSRRYHSHRRDRFRAGRMAAWVVRTAPE